VFDIDSYTQEYLFFNPVKNASTIIPSKYTHQHK